jgi:hypothetical protein
VLGLFFVETTQAMSAADYLKAVWLELKVQEAAVWGSRLQIFGVHAIDYPDPDPTHFYFQAPGRLVFRLASLKGGLCFNRFRTDRDWVAEELNSNCQATS